MNPYPPIPRALARRILMLNLLRHGIGIAGEYGWTADDWAQAAAVPWAVLHAALEGRIIDEAGCLALIQALGLTITDPGLGACTLRCHLPPARKAPMLSLACAHCGRRSTLVQVAADGQDCLRCSACLALRPYAARLLATPAAATTGPAPLVVDAAAIGATTPGLVRGT
jgi:hypothetical protein